MDRTIYLAATEEMLTQIEAMGFKVAVYLSGHYPGVIPPVAEKFNARGGMKVISLSENNAVEGMPAGDHAAGWETAVLMVLRPGLVDISRLPALPKGIENAGEVIPPPWPFLPRSEYYGIYGSDPRVWANVTFGKRGVEAVIEGLGKRVREVLNDANYGRQIDIRWPQDERKQPEVRYDFLLPYQWMTRYEQMPIVYWPLVTSTESPTKATERAEKFAREYGGMVFPALSYAPANDGQSVSIPTPLFKMLVPEIVQTFATMGFRAVVLMPSDAVDSRMCKKLSEVKMDDGQGRVVVATGGELPGDFRKTIEEFVPGGQAVVRELNEGWTVNGQWILPRLSDAVYGPSGPSRVYECSFEMSEEEAGKRILLDIGVVENLCEVKFNDGQMISDHWAPYRIILTGRAKAGTNKLTVTVRHVQQTTLADYYYRVASPRLAAPVKLVLW